MADPKILGPNNELIEQFLKVGIVPKNCTRIVLDIRYDDITKLYYKCLGDERLIEIDIPKALGPNVKLMNKEG